MRRFPVILQKAPTRLCLIEFLALPLEARKIIPNPIMVITSVDVSGIGDAGGGLKIGSGPGSIPGGGDGPGSIGAGGSLRAVVQDAKVSTHGERRELTNNGSTLAGVSGERSRTVPGGLRLGAEGGFDSFSATLLLFGATVVPLPLTCFVSFGSPADWSVISKIPQRARSGPSAEAPPQLAT